MPRQWSSPHKNRAPAPAPVPKPVPSRSIAAYTPPAAPSPSVGSILKESFAFGVGQSAGFHAVSAMLSPFTRPKQEDKKETQSTIPSNPCQRESTAFERCLVSDNYTGHNCIQEQSDLAQCVKRSDYNKYSKGSD